MQLTNDYLPYGGVCLAATSCATYAGFTAYPDSDHIGDDSVYYYFDELELDWAAEACLNSEYCSGFNSAGQVKGNEFAPGLDPVPAPGMCLWIRNRECLVVRSSSSWWRAALAVGVCTGLFSRCASGAWPSPHLV